MPNYAEQFYCTNLSTSRATLLPNGTNRGTGSRKRRATEALRDRTHDEQFQLDISMWYGSLTYGTPWKVRMMRRLFAILYHGGLMFRFRGRWVPWATSNLPIAAALSHGGRVLIQLPMGEDDPLWPWLWSGHSSESRMAATHGVVFDATPQALPLGHEKVISEVHACSEGDHFGINFASGGVGNLNPYSGNRIVEDGEHGHLYFYYLKPRADRCGCILVGAEDSAPIDRFSKFGKRHRTHVFAQGQSGHKHTFGKSGTFSHTGGRKWVDLAGRAAAVQAIACPYDSLDAMFVDLATNGHDDLLAEEPEYSFNNLELLVQSGRPPNGADAAPQRANIPSAAVWKALSGKLKSALKRDDLAPDQGGVSHNADLFEQITAAIAAHEATPTDLTRDGVRNLCRIWLNDLANLGNTFYHDMIIRDLYVRSCTGDL